MASVYDFSALRLDGHEQILNDYRGKVLLIVNTASKCGFTPQYAGLEELYETYRARGFEVLGFPCDQFAHQEPGTADEIGAFCQKNYGVTFPMFDKIDVNGAATHPLYQHLKKAEPGILGTEGIKWNFTKFLINREGKVVKRFAPKDAPASIAKDVEALL